MNRTFLSNENPLLSGIYPEKAQEMDRIKLNDQQRRYLLRSVYIYSPKQLESKLYYLPQHLKKTSLQSIKNLHTNLSIVVNPAYLLFSI